jgi:hypothetical protein
MPLNESHIEKASLEWLAELGYESVCLASIETLRRAAIKLTISFLETHKKVH